MKYRVIEPFVTKKGIIEKGSVIEIPESMADRLEGKIEPLMDAVWPTEMQKLINWFLSADLPQNSFSPSDFETVLHPAKYYQVLRSEITAGPRHPRGAVLQGDLQRLHDYCERRKQ